MKHGNQLSFFDYVKAAFGWKIRIGLLGELPVNILVLTGFGILGFGHPGFWLLGLAYEAGYLLFLSGNERFQKVVSGVRLLDEAQGWERKKQDLIAILDKSSRDRYNHVVALSGSILEMSGDGIESAAEDLRFKHLNQLLWTFLQLLVSRQRIRGTLFQVLPADLEKEMADMREKLEKESPDSALYRSMQGTMEIAQRRLENVTRAAENLKVVDAELERIEKQFALVREEAAVGGTPEAMTARLDGVMQSLHDTSRWLSDHKELLGSSDTPILPEILQQAKG